MSIQSLVSFTQIYVFDLAEQFKIGQPLKVTQMSYQNVPVLYQVITRY